MGTRSWQTLVVAAVILLVGCGAAAPVDESSILPATLDPTAPASQAKESAQAAIRGNNPQVAEKFINLINLPFEQSAMEVLSAPSAPPILTSGTGQHTGDCPGAQQKTVTGFEGLM